MASDTHTSQRWAKGTLVVGFVSLAIGVLVAHGSPPDAYELSIYADTPVAFWAGTAIALILSVVVGLGADRWPRRLALGLGGSAVFAVTALPVVRSYHYFGAGDSLTHLGWAKDIAVGKLSVLNLLYPGTHTIAVFLSDVTGMALPRAILSMVLAFDAVFLVFVPLVVWTVTRRRRATALAAFSAFLLLPITNISVYQMSHPSSQATLFSPLLLYLVARYVVGVDRNESVVGGDQADRLAGTPTGALLAVASVAVVLVHPQQSLNVVFVFAAVFGLQLCSRVLDSQGGTPRLLARVPGTQRLARWWGGRERSHRLLGFQTAFLVGVFLLWAPRHERASGAASALVGMLFDGPQVGAEVTQQAVSLSAVGGSVLVVFLKLFFVSTVFCALAGLLVLSGFLGRLEDSPDVAAFARYFGLGLGLVGTLFTAYFVVSYSQLHFRQLGFMLVLVTILGAIALSKVTGVLSTWVSSQIARTLVGSVLVVMLVLSLLTVYQSPYMYKSSSHVTEAQMEGYETAIDHRGSARFIGIRGAGERWVDAVLGYEESRRKKLAVGSLYQNPDHPAVGANFTGEYVARHYSDRYLAFTDRTVQNDVQILRGLRFDEEGFQSLDASPGLDRVQTNDDVQVYLVNETA